MDFARTLDRYRRCEADRRPFWEGAPPADVGEVCQQFAWLSAPRLAESVRFLAELKDPRSVPALSDLLYSTRVDLARDVAQAIATVGGPAACPGLLRALELSSSEVVRLAAAYGLTWLLDDRAFDALLHVYGDRAESRPLRVQAAEGLVYLAANLPRFTPRWKAAAEAFLRGLDETDPDLRFWSIHALGALRATWTASRLRVVAHSDGAFSPAAETFLRHEALDALRSISAGETESRGAA